MSQENNTCILHGLVSKLEDLQQHLELSGEKVPTANHLNARDHRTWDEFTAWSLDSSSKPSFSQGPSTTSKPSTIPTSQSGPEADGLPLEEGGSDNAVCDSDSDRSSQSSASSAYLPNLKGYVFDDAAVEGVGNFMWEENEWDTGRDHQDLLAVHEEERKAVLARLDPFSCEFFLQSTYRHY